MGVDSRSPSRFFLPLVGLGIQVHLQVEGPLEQASLQMESSTYQALGFPGSGNPQLWENSLQAEKYPI